MFVLIYSYWLWLFIRAWLLTRGHASISGHWKRKNRLGQEDKTLFRTHPKPAWVKQEIIRLKAYMPDQGCRKVAHTFNRLYKKERKMSVGKTFVSNVIRDHQYDIQVLRKKVKHRKPPVLSKNIIWQVDLTGKATKKKPRQSILGIIDHGCRACIALSTLPRKSSIRILICLLQAMDTLGKPKLIRTDNETVFTSRLFKLVLWLLNIRHQRTELHCPWQNGRIERLFLTLKQKINPLVFETTDGLNDFLQQFRFWYNFVRPHQHLDGKVPAEVWSKRSSNPKKATWFEDETGLLRGYYLPPN